MEETLYNLAGYPVAYIAFPEESSIYLWNGTPVAYLYEDAIYGFNGKHMGWYDNGRIRDLSGFIVGFNKATADVYTKYEPYKSYKKYRPYRRYRQYKRYKPYFSRSKSSVPLDVFLMEGRA